jgi:ATPase subunit of ABC transporter with duplicated ATPase domains
LHCLTPRGRKQSAGCAVVISHDRWFLDRIATHILAFEGESKVTFFDGNLRGMCGWHDAGCTAGDRGGGGQGGGCSKPWPTAARRSRHFSEYEAWPRQTPGDAASRPHRITYRKLTT